jgi:hypothetical protein
MSRYICARDDCEFGDKRNGSRNWRICTSESSNACLEDAEQTFRLGSGQIFHCNGGIGRSLRSYRLVAPASPRHKARLGGRRVASKTGSKWMDGVGTSLRYQSGLPAKFSGRLVRAHRPTKSERRSSTGLAGFR